MTSNKMVALACVACLLALGVMIALVFRLESLARIASGPQELPIAISSQHLDFGHVPLYGSVIRELVVRNDSAGPVRARVSVDGTNFTASPEQLLLHPGVEFSISVVVTAEKPGSLDEELLIMFEDWDVGPVVVLLEAQGDVFSGDGEAEERYEWLMAERARRQGSEDVALMGWASGDNGLKSLTNQRI